MLDLVQQNWHIPEQHAAGLTIEKIFTATLEHRFILDESYGGCKLDTYQEDWTEEREVKYEIVVDIQAGKCVHFWQFVLGIGEREWSQDVLFTQHVIMTETASQPTQVPLQKANTVKEKQADKKTQTAESAWVSACMQGTGSMHELWHETKLHTLYIVSRLVIAVSIIMCSVYAYRSVSQLFALWANKQIYAHKSTYQWNIKPTAWWKCCSCMTPIFFVFLRMLHLDHLILAQTTSNFYCSLGLECFVYHDTHSSSKVWMLM